MDCELTSTLHNRYPSLFAENNAKLMLEYRIPLDCGDGWFDILDECFAKLAAFRYPYDEDIGPSSDHIVLRQVKEKYGTLRIYTSCCDEADKVIEVAEARSAVTCETCGNPGVLRRKFGWYSTLCDSCGDGYEVLR